MSLLRSLSQAAVAVHPVARQVHTEITRTGTVGIRSRVAPVEPPVSYSLVKDICDRQDRTPEVSRVGATGYMHVSSLIGPCIRQHVLARRFEAISHNEVTGGHRVLWALGRAVERHIRDQVIADRDFSAIYGIWHCLCRAIKIDGFFPKRHGECAKCGTVPRYYGEPALFDHENKIVGSPDLTLLVGNNYFMPVEVKSMEGEAWKSLVKPLPDHVLQVASYHRLYGLTGKNIFRRAAIVYGSKAFKWGSPYKEFQVDCGSGEVFNHEGKKVDTLPVSEMVETTLDFARQIRDHSAASTLPERTTCRAPTDTRAKACGVCHFCFDEHIT